MAAVYWFYCCILPASVRSVYIFIFFPKLQIAAHTKMNTFDMRSYPPDEKENKNIQIIRIDKPIGSFQTAFSNKWCQIPYFFLKLWKIDEKWCVRGYLKNGGAKLLLILENLNFLVYDLRILWYFFVSKVTILVYRTLSLKVCLPWSIFFFIFPFYGNFSLHEHISRNKNPSFKSIQECYIWKHVEHFQIR